MLERETRREKALEQKVIPSESDNTDKMHAIERFKAPTDDALNQYFEEALKR